jgi:hypothetical protein
MPAQRIVSSQDGPRLTLAQLVKAPTVIPERIIQMTDQEFLTDDVLRPGDDAPSGVVMFSESTPLFTDEDPAILDEFGQIPVVNGSIGTPRVVRTVRRAMGLRISLTMIKRNAIRVVTNQMTQIKNTMVRAWEDAFFSAMLANPNILTIATDQPWGSATSHIRKDVNAARYLIKTAAADAAGKQKFGFRADTLILSDEMELDFLDSDEVTKPYEGGNVADQNLKFTGVLPKKFLTLDVFVSWRLATYAPGSAIVMQRKTAGFISDERPLESTPLYGEGNGPNGGPRESYRCDTTRQSAIGIDQPKAICLITGVTTGETFPTSGGTITV